MKAETRNSTKTNGNDTPTRVPVYRVLLYHTAWSGITLLFDLLVVVFVHVCVCVLCVCLDSCQNAFSMVHVK